MEGFIEPVRDGLNPHERIMRQAAELTGGAELALIDWREGHWLFARQPIVHFGFQSEVTVDHAASWLRSHPQSFALVPLRDLARCFRQDKARRLGETSRADWFLVGSDADNGRCGGEPPARVYRFTWHSPLQ